MSIDLKGMTRKELERLIRDAEKALARIRTQELKAAKQAAEKVAAAHGFSLSDLTGEPKTASQKARTSKRKPGVQKYRNPVNPDQTWTGKGRQPEWFKTAVSRGTDPKEMEI